MKKPEHKKRLAISEVVKSSRYIGFYTDSEMAQKLERFGTITESLAITDHYSILVDSRFDFDEVLEYIENYGCDG